MGWQMTAGVSLQRRHVFDPLTWRMVPVDYTPTEQQQVKNTKAAQIKKQRALVKSLAPNKSNFCTPINTGPANVTRATGANRTI